MPEKWDDAREKRLLLEVIAITNPTVERSAWASVAVAMGEGVTAEACRQKFQGIKRNLKALNGDATPDTTNNNTSTPKAAKATKPKTPTSASAAASCSKGRKRKAAEADDDESKLFTPKAQKAKSEKATNGNVVGAEVDGIGAEVFKVEEEGEGVDLERDDLYDNAV